MSQYGLVVQSPSIEPARLQLRILHFEDVESCTRASTSTNAGVVDMEDDRTLSINEEMKHPHTHNKATVLPNNHTAVNNTLLHC